MKVKKKVAEISEKEMAIYNALMNDARRMRSFMGEMFNEREWLDSVILAQKERMTTLLSSYEKNASIFNNREMGAWLVAFNESSKAYSKFDAIKNLRFPDNLG